MNEKCRILVLDDETLILLTISACLKNVGYDVTVSSSAVEAIELFKRQKYDVVITDIMMDALDGFQFRDLLRKYNKRIPIIFLTSLMDDIDHSLLNRILSDSYSYYLNKSFTNKSLSEKVHQVVNAYQSQFELQTLQNQIESDLELAHHLQRALLPPRFYVKDGYASSFLYKPQFKVSGDLFEIFPVAENRCVCFCGDIAGHGIHSALIMSVIQAMIKQMITSSDGSELQLSSVLLQIHRFFVERLNTQSYMTCMIGIWDFNKNRLSYHLAGHPDIICLRQGSNSIIELNPENRGSAPLGLFKNSKFLESDTVNVQFEDDDLFFFYTDGLLDVSTNEKNVDSVELSQLKELIAAYKRDSNFLTFPFRMKEALEQIGFTHLLDDTFAGMLGKLPDSPKIWISALGTKLENIDEGLHNLVDWLEKAQKIDVDFACRIELLLSEFLVNIVRHGIEAMQNNPGEICVQVELTDFGAKIVVLDSGVNWNAELLRIGSAQNADEMLDLLNASRAQNGRGMPIILKLTKEIHRFRYFDINATTFILENSKQEE